MQSLKTFISRLGNQIILSALIMTTTLGASAQQIHGFKLKEKRFVKEINAECYHYEHVKSGASLVKIANDDPNKTFCIGFKTFPESDNGIAHIMEHAVLNGSKNFPVKSPFDVLSKGSLKTFLNAFTSKDMTMYPVASMNEKDYFNLMHVYLDAVFNPLIYTDERILKQEGWHRELGSPEEDVIYKGVVYNEMKGAFSNPSRYLRYYSFMYLFPDNPYGKESGGYPPAITTLTNEEFLAFHRRNYHPGNSFILVYGNADLDKELAFINEQYLSKYDRLDKPVTIKDQPPFSALKQVTAHYPVMEGEPLADKTYLSLTFTAGQNTDLALVEGLSLICDLLVNQETAPLRLAMQQAGIGKDISAYPSDYKQNVVQITVEGANPADLPRFKDLFFSTVRETLKKGYDKDELKGLLNRLEFQLREGADAQKGLTYYQVMRNGWIFAGDPFAGLQYEKTLAGIKKALDGPYLEEITEKYFLNNPHALLLCLEPKPGLDNEHNATVAEELKAYKAGLSQEALDKLVKETNELIAYQKRDDDPAALATIPLLTLGDVNPKAMFYTTRLAKAGEMPVLLHETFTNSVSYMNLYFDLRVLPQELLPYASLLADLIGLFDTEKYGYGELNKLLNMHTGGAYTSMKHYMENLDDEGLIPKFQVFVKTMNDKVDLGLDLGAEILLHTRFEDVERLKTVLTRLQSQLESAAKRDGLNIAMNRLPSYFSQQGVYKEITGGLEYYWFVTRLQRELDSKAPQIFEKLKLVSSLLFSRQNCMAALTGSKQEQEVVIPALKRFAEKLPVSQVKYQHWALVPEQRNEGILTSSKVQYVIEGYNFKKLGYPWDGKMRVLSQVLSSDYLQNQIRVIGGAYGGFSRISPDGTLTLNSYRDPNLKETLDNYTGAVDYLKTLQINQTDLSRYIIGTISSMDRPMTPPQQGDLAFSYYFTKRDQAAIQKDRDAVLSTRLEDIKAFSTMLSDVLKQKTICVYGNSEKITASKDLFGKLIQIELE